MKWYAICYLCEVVVVRCGVRQGKGMKRCKETMQREKEKKGEKRKMKEEE
jgi:hypothetical protein